MANTITIDTHTLEHIPADKRDTATEYTCSENIYTQKDADHSEIPDDKNVGDVREAEHQRWTVTYEA